MATGTVAPFKNSSISSDSSSSNSDFYESSDDSVVDKNFVPLDDDESSDISEVSICFWFCGISCFTKTMPSKFCTWLIMLWLLK